MVRPSQKQQEGRGELYRAAHTDGSFELRGNFLKGMRQAAVLVDKHLVHIFYTRVGDTPERFLMAEMDMCGEWLTW